MDILEINMNEKGKISPNNLFIGYVGENKARKLSVKIDESIEVSKVYLEILNGEEQELQEETITIEEQGKEPITITKYTLEILEDTFKNNRNIVNLKINGITEGQIIKSETFILNINPSIEEKD